MDEPQRPALVPWQLGWTAERATRTRRLLDVISETRNGVLQPATEAGATGQPNKGRAKASRDQAKLVFQYALAFIESSSVLKQEIDSVSQTELRLRNNIVISMHANSFRSIRGRTIVACVFDEVALWRDEVSATPDVEVYRAGLLG